MSSYNIDMNDLDRITQVYEEQANQCIQAVSRLYSEIEELARKTCYKPIVDFGNTIYEFYGTELRSHLISEFEKWYDGRASFHALMEGTRAGSSAVAFARSKMDRMRETLEGMFRQQNSPIRVDTTVPKFNDSSFDEYKNALKTCERSIDSALSYAEQAIKGMSGDNEVWNLITDIVKTTGESLRDSFRQMQKPVEEGNELAYSGNRTSQSEIRGKAKTVEKRWKWITK